MNTVVKDLRQLCEQIANDPSAVDSMTTEDIAATMQFLNPLNTVVSANKSYANMSIVNWRERYLRRIHMTALVGYLYRTCEEYEPESLLEAERKAWAAETAGLTGAELEKSRKLLEQRCRSITTSARGVIRQYLNRNFMYNPDRHVREATTDREADPERKDLQELQAELKKAREAAAAAEAKLAQKQEQFYQFTRNCYLAAAQSAGDAAAAVKSCLAVLIDPKADLEDKQGILFKKYSELCSIVEEMRPIAEPLARADTVHAACVTPPVDVFHHFDRYLANHYEQFRDIVSAAYSEKPDIEFAVIYYGAHDSLDSAREYRIQHEADFKTDVFTIENNGTTLLGPFRENRGRVDFYNKNTEILKKMDDQLKSDHKLGKDLMEKQIKVQKRKNILEAGPDAPELAAYAKQMNLVRELGAKSVLTDEEKAQLAEAKSTATAIAEDYAVPDESIQVDMFAPHTGPDGQQTLRRTKFYTQAEAPLHLQEGSEYAGEYQPRRAPGEPIRKTIVSKTGEKKRLGQ